MEMTLTVHLPRRRPHPVDVVVRWSGRHTAADLCARLTEHLGEPVTHLTCRGRAVHPAAVVGEPPLLHGAAVSVGALSAATTDDRVDPVEAGVLEVAVVGGPDAGHARPLSPPAVLVGRAPASGVLVRDEALSRVHAVFRIGRAGVVVEDEGSTNGVLVDGRRVVGPVPVDAASLVVAGSTALRLRRAAGPGLPVVAGGDGRVTVPEPRAPAADSGPVEVECPAAPPERHRARVPWVAALVPVPIGAGLAWFLGPQLLVFALLGPVMLLASALGDRWGAGRAGRRDGASHDAAVQRAKARLAQCLAEERARLDRAHPDPHALLSAAEHLLPGLWGGDARLSLRLGIGEVATRVVWRADGRPTHPTARTAPVVLPLVDVGCLGVVGPHEVTDAVLRSVVGQLCATQPPTRVAVAVVSTLPEWSWCARLPHHQPPPRRAGAAADTGVPSGAPAGRVSTAGGGDHGPRLRVLVVPGGEAAANAGLVAAARSAGWHAVVAAPDRGSLPVGCGAVLTVGPGDGHLLESSSGPAVPLVADGVGAWWVERLSRALAPLRCAAPSSGAGSGPVPDRVVIDDVLPPGGTDPDALAAGWGAATARGAGLATPVARVGVGPDGIHAIDLTSDGPHVLVGGTTGSGKSEFLRTLVTSLAVSCPPSDLSLVLIDFKGGAAFGPCAELPHVVGLVTDLDDHLVSRALTSLRAELRRRERLLADAGAMDLEAYARSPRGHQEPVPRLVVVVDELRTLVDEVPDFVSGIVRLAAQGRSLGIHLVLATQRPAGAVTAEVQANVSLRIAFRVRDRSDSVAVVEDGAAADIGPHTPGRAVARGADGHLRTFQSAIIGPPPDRELPASLEVFAVGAVRDQGRSLLSAGPGHHSHPDPGRHPGGDRDPGPGPTPGGLDRARRTGE
ncbi:MAG TPA: FtsK/SpoIIIE domain-containing protein, partial [Ornithinibacter sp.]|nr:FtsK/SpoIIIE domain-containing protein [Ornithinibacter sp.]